ncbi:hypothetical protein HY095_01320 [Candidatus Micrarchaeota archaeon]|nr:hypothetical protein [Candidatus Micrarchaeota archaeon]
MKGLMQNNWKWYVGGAITALGLSVFLPPAGLLIGMVVSFFACGLIALRALGLELDPLEEAVVAAVLSVLVSTQAVYWLSSALGYSQSVIALALISCCVPMAFGKGGRLRPDWMPRWMKGISRHKLALAGGLLIFAAFLISFSGNAFVERNGSIVVGGWNWSDLFVHLPIVTAINSGAAGFPPQVPFAAGNALDYHWFSDLHTAFLAKLGGLFPNGIIWLENAFYAALFFLAVYALAFAVLKNPKAALLAAILVFLAGGLGFTKFLGDVSAGKGSPLGLLTANAYDNDWGFFQIPSLIGGYLIVQRPMMAGLAAIAAASLLFILAIQHWRENAPRQGVDARGMKLLLAGWAVVGLSAPFQYYAFITAAFLGAIAIAWLCLNGRITVRGALVSMLPAAVAVPFVLVALALSASANSIKFSPGWLAPSHGALSFLWFYAANLGPVFWLAISALAVAAFGTWRPKRRERSSVEDSASPTHLLGMGRAEIGFLACWLSFGLVLPNLLSFSGLAWDMTKFFALAAIPAGILAAALVSAFVKNRAVWIFIIIFCGATGALIFYWNSASAWVALSPAEVSAGNWVGQYAPVKSVFVTSYSIHSPVDSIGGRRRTAGYVGWFASHLIADSGRAERIRSVYCAPDSREAYESAVQLGATHVYLGANERNDYPCAMQSLRDADLFRKAYEQDGVEIFQLQTQGNDKTANGLGSQPQSQAQNNGNGTSGLESPPQLQGQDRASAPGNLESSPAFLSGNVFLSSPPTPASMGRFLLSAFFALFLPGYLLAMARRREKDLLSPLGGKFGGVGESVSAVFESLIISLCLFGLAAVGLVFTIGLSPPSILIAVALLNITSWFLWRESLQ